MISWSSMIHSTTCLCAFTLNNNTINNYLLKLIKKYYQNTEQELQCFLRCRHLSLHILTYSNYEYYLQMAFQKKYEKVLWWRLKWIMKSCDQVWNNFYNACEFFLIWTPSPPPNKSNYIWYQASSFWDYPSPAT